jgi:hypothetical protein
MTERTYSLPPQIATPTTSANHVATSHTPKDTVAPAESVDEEPYTIKCICDFTDDDGATIYCEKCDTWQHIECFYHGMVEVASRDDFTHFCVDCQPRTLDRRKATERQRQARQDKSSHDVDEKKTKRPPSKSHKKKPRPSDVQTNGHHDHEAGHTTKHGSPHDTPSHAKKPKSAHRSHHSISSIAAKRSPSHNSRQNGSGHPPSPATTPPDLPGHFVLHSYSKQLQDLYDNDPGHQELQANIASLPVTNTMSSWLRDPEKLRADTGIENGSDVFTHPKAGYDLTAYPWPELQTNSKEIVADDAVLHLRYLSVVKPLLKKDQLIGELKGTVGFQKDYYAEESDRYQKLCHPAPFVFFHPHLPLYIDTRREGSQCRYIRRSCRPNTSLDTFIIHQSEYHFIVVTDRPLASNEEVTMAWDFRFMAHVKDRYLNLLGLSDQESVADSDLSQLEYDELTELIHNLLSEYGGCACGLGSDCAFARFHRNYLGKLQSQSNGTKSKKGRKPKQHHSPASTSHATTSRDASEGRQDQYDAEDDSRSASGSVRSKPQSRDMSPLRHGSEVNGAATDKISERDKRKIDSIEKTFEKMEQTTAQPPKKKKRMSDGSATTTNNSTVQNAPKPKSKSTSRPSILNSSSSTQPSVAVRQYKDVSTSQRPSESPTARQSPAEGISPTSRQPSAAADPQPQSPATPSNYVTSSTQTDAGFDEWFEDSRPSPPRKTIIPLSKRLLSSRHKQRAELEARRAQQDETRRASLMIAVEPHQPSNDTIMTDASDTVSLPIKTSPERAPSVTLETPEETQGVLAAQPTIKASEDEDTPMLDAPCVAGKPEPPIWLESVPATSTKEPSPTMVRSPELKVQTLSATNSSSNLLQSTPPTPNGTVTPSSAAGTIVQSPFLAVHFPTAFSPAVLSSVGQNPSPIKKKLSLSDYRARLKQKPEPVVKTTIISDTVAAPAVSETSSPLTEEIKFNGALEGSAIVETPAAIEKVDDPLADAVSASSEAPPTTNGAGTGVAIV